MQIELKDYGTRDAWLALSLARASSHSPRSGPHPRNSNSAEELAAAAKGPTP